jgi:hypothetical protein
VGTRERSRAIVQENPGIALPTRIEDSKGSGHAEYGFGDIVWSLITPVVNRLRPCVHNDIRGAVIVTHQLQGVTVPLQGFSWLYARGE